MSGGRYSIRMLLSTIAAGIIYSLVAEIFYQKVDGVIPGILLILIYLAGLFLVLGATVYLVGKLIYSRTSGSINMKQWIIVFLGILLLSVVFEFLYEIVNIRDKEQEITSYLFVLDDSGSMNVNDPQNIRYQAIDTLLESKDDSFQYGIYSFSDVSQVLRNMAPKNVEQDYGTPDAYGGTSIMGTLKDISDDIESGNLTIDKHCKVVFLSDGYATDINLFNKHQLSGILRSFSQRGICISTVGLANADDSLMSMIADKTGGVYVKVDDVSALEEAMTHAAATMNTNRNLLGYRACANLDILLGIMRVLFIAILGLVIALEKTILSERFLDTSSVLISSVVGSILAGLCIEIGMNTLGIHPTIMRMITCALIAFTLLKKDLRNRDEADGGVKYADR